LTKLNRDTTVYHSYSGVSGREKSRALRARLGRIMGVVLVFECEVEGCSADGALDGGVSFLGSFSEESPGGERRVCEEVCGFDVKGVRDLLDVLECDVSVCDDVEVLG